MSFFSRESSIEKGKPYSLYEFTRGGALWAYTNADRDITFTRPGDAAPTVYSAITISDAGIVQSGSAATDDLKITLTATAPVLVQYFGTPPSETVYVTIRKQHFGDADAPVHYVGQVQAVGSKNAVEVNITCFTLGATFKRDGLRLAWQRTCPHMLYDVNCKVDREVYKIGANLELVTGSVLQAEELLSRDTGYFDGGFIEWTKGGLIDRRPIQIHVENTLTLLGFADGLEVGQHFYVFPGCARIIQVCNDKFNNRLNFGGFPHMPGSSPFDGDPVF